MFVAVPAEGTAEEKVRLQVVQSPDHSHPAKVIVAPDKDSEDRTNTGDQENVTLL